MSLDLEALASQPLESLGSATVTGVVRRGRSGDAPKYTARARPAKSRGGRRGGRRGGDARGMRYSDVEEDDEGGGAEYEEESRQGRRGERYFDEDDEDDTFDASGRARRRRRHRQSSDEGDLSARDEDDDHASDSDPNSTDSSADSLAPAASDKYKVRYQVLREAYEARLKSLVTQMHATYADTVRDEAVRALGDRPETAPFVPLRRQEVVREALESETEESFQRATHDLAKQASELHRAKRRIRGLKKQMRQMSRDRRDLKSARNELGSTQTELSRLRHTQVAEQQELRETMQVLRDSLAESREAGGRKMTEVEQEMAKRMNRMEVLVERMLRYNNDIKGRGEQGRGTAEGKEGAAASAENARLRSKLTKAKRLLAQSERERLELRQKYLAIGANVEQLIRADTEATNADVERWQGRYRALRAKLTSSVKKCKLRAREIATARGRQRDAEKAKAAAEARATQMSEALGECRVQLAQNDGSVEALASAQGRIAALEASLDRVQRDSTAEIDRARIESREAQAERLTEAEVRVAKLEGELLRAQADQDARLETIVAAAKVETRRKYELMVEEKLGELRAAHEATLHAQERSRKDEDDLRAQVGHRLKEIAADHIPLAQHNTVVQTKMDSCRAEYEAEIEATRLDAEREAIERVEENTARLTAQFAALEAELRRSLAEGSARERDAAEARRDAEKAFEEERQALMRVKEDLLDAQAGQKKLGGHLTEASANIERLKGMVTRSRTESARLEKALLQERSRRKDEEDLMKRELRQRTEKHQADAQSLETQRLAVATSKTRVAEAEEETASKKRECVKLNKQLEEVQAELTRMQSIVRETAAARDNFELLANRDSRRVTELERALELANATAETGRTRQMTDRAEERERAAKEIMDVQEELLAVQKQFRSADMARLKHEDEVKAMQDRIESLRSLSKEREAALVQQLQTFRKTADKSSVSAEQAWSAQVDQLSQQLKDAHASHADTHEDLDALTNKIRETEAAVRNAESERDLAIKRCESANTLAMEHGASLASVRGELEALTSAHDALKLSDASKASAIAKYEADLEEMRSIAAARSASVSKLKAEITDLRAQAEKERERFEEALDEAMQAGDDLEEERRALSGKLKRAKTGRTREKQGHEIEVKQMMEEMEARFEVTEAELRKVILSKSTELENLRHRLREMQEIQDSAAASMAASEETGSAVVLQQLQSELRVLRRRASEYEEKGSAVSSADRIASSREEELMAESLALRARISQFENDKAELQRALARARRRTRAAFTEAQ